MIAMFTNVKAFAVFNAKPHLFSYGEPYQFAGEGKDEPVFVDLVDGDAQQFCARVEQFDGLVLGK